MKKCCVKICANDKKVDFSKVQKQMVTVKELSLDSFKHVPLETWALEPENTYKPTKVQMVECTRGLAEVSPRRSSRE